MYNKQNDWNLICVSAITNGNQSEISRMYYSMKDWLTNLTKRNEEVAHDIFLSLIRKIQYYDSGRSDLHNFLFTVAKNEYRDIIRPRKRIEKTKLDIVSFSDLSYDDDEKDGRRMIEAITADQEELIDYDLISEKVFEIIGQDDYNFMLNYIESNETKTETQRSKFYYLKKKVTAIIYK